MVDFERSLPAPDPAASAVMLGGDGHAGEVAHVADAGRATGGGVVIHQPTTVSPPATPSAPALPGPTLAARPSGPMPPRATRLPDPMLRTVGLALVLLAAFLLGFAGYLYGLSGAQEARSQSNMYQQLQGEFANEVAPLGYTTQKGVPTLAPSVPMAVLSIPAIGIKNMVVVEGTSSENLTLGPGHLSNSPLPGQAGLSEIYGRRATFGGPFSRIGQLHRGDVITVITGQGKSTYKVAGIGGSHLQINDSAPNRLLLLTASSTGVPAYYISVDARLTSPPKSGYPVPQLISSSNLPLSGDTGALGTTVVWALALAAVSMTGTLAAMRWSAWPAWLAAAPLALAVLWNLYQNLSALLPNLY
jgi:sortase A